jgi:ectoine hydroxylase-related dioxygenase (phytanoyl-CoA dioxygenase family)
MSKLVILPSTATVDEVCEVIMRDGGVIVEDMLSSEVLDGFMKDVSPYLAQTPFGEEIFTGSLTRRTSALMAKSRYSQYLLNQPHLVGAARKLLPTPYNFVMGDTAMPMLPTVQLSVTQAIQIWPGQKAQVLHRDDALHHRVHPGPECQVQVLYAATDFTEENGATHVIPGSHRWDDERKPLMSETVRAVMKKGSGLIYYGSLYHGGGENSSKDELRTALTFSYILGYLRQEENQYLVVPRETVKQYPREVQELMGYKVCPPFCGFVEMQEPTIVLETDDFSVGAASALVN